MYFGSTRRSGALQDASTLGTVVVSFMMLSSELHPEAPAPEEVDYSLSSSDGGLLRLPCP